MGSIETDVVVVGAGILGLATARALQQQRPGLSITVVDKEPAVASHQSGRNSGVVHSGLYYRPGSEKARMVAESREAVMRFADDHGIPIQRCGKVVVAADTSELGRLLDLRANAEANGIESRVIDRAEMQRIEPHVEGMLALLVPGTAVIDFAGVSRVLADQVTEAGGRVVLGAEVVSIRSDGGGQATHVSTTADEYRTRVLAGCAGLQADRLAAMAGLDLGGVRILPFRGEYWRLRPERSHLVRHLVYPVPDPRFPFLGVHFNRGVDGEVHVGPNAVAALAREGYRWRDIEASQLAQLIRDPAPRRLARRYPTTGAIELLRSAIPRAFLRAAQRLVPEVRRRDLIRAGSGVRAQAVDAAGGLLDDFAFAEGPTTVFVLNAPSPGATAAFGIGAEVASRILSRLDDGTSPGSPRP